MTKNPLNNSRRERQIMEVLYRYRPKVAREKIASGLLKNLVSNFFQGRPSDAICAMFEEHGARLSPEDIERIQQRIEKAKSETCDE